MPPRRAPHCCSRETGRRGDEGQPTSRLSVPMGCEFRFLNLLAMWPSHRKGINPWQACDQMQPLFSGLVDGLRLQDRDASIMKSWSEAAVADALAPWCLQEHHLMITSASQSIHKSKLCHPLWSCRRLAWVVVAATQARHTAGTYLAGPPHILQIAAQCCAS